MRLACRAVQVRGFVFAFHKFTRLRVVRLIYGVHAWLGATGRC